MTTSKGRGKKNDEGSLSRILASSADFEKQGRKSRTPSQASLPSSPRPRSGSRSTPTSPAQHSVSPRSEGSVSSLKRGTIPSTSPRVNVANIRVPTSSSTASPAATSTGAGGRRASPSPVSTRGKGGTGRPGDSRSQEMDQRSPSGAELDERRFSDSSAGEGRDEAGEGCESGVEESRTSIAFEKVTVAVRVRPMSSKDKKAEEKKAIFVDGSTITVKDDMTLKKKGAKAAMGGRAEAEVESEPSLSFTFDIVQEDNEDASGDAKFTEVLQEQFYERFGAHCVESAMEGYNVTVFAYGQTGAGKTHTMMGDGTLVSGGVVPRLSSALLKAMEEAHQGEPESHIQASFLEVYHEKVRDLLAGPMLDSAPASPSGERHISRDREGSHGGMDAYAGGSDNSSTCGSDDENEGASGRGGARGRREVGRGSGRASATGGGQKGVRGVRAVGSPGRGAEPRRWGSESVVGDALKVREHPKTGPYVEGLTKRYVRSWPEMEALLSQGLSSRTTAATDMNDRSSRSHTVFTLTVTQRVALEGGAASQRVGYVNLVDLAGSERQTRTKASGMRLKEAGYINKSLSLLNDVITQLARGGSFVPYRNSTLTWLLKDSLGGNSRTVMIASVSPISSDMAETISTLRYANRAKRIKNKPKVNEDLRDLLIRTQKDEILSLRMLIETLTQQTIPTMPEKPPMVDVGIQVQMMYSTRRGSALDLPDRSHQASHTLRSTLGSPRSSAVSPRSRTSSLFSTVHTPAPRQKASIRVHPLPVDTTLPEAYCISPTTPRSPHTPQNSYDTSGSMGFGISQWMKDTSAPSEAGDQSKTTASTNAPESPPPPTSKVNRGGPTGAQSAPTTPIRRRTKMGDMDGEGEKKETRKKTVVVPQGPFLRKSVFARLMGLEKGTSGGDSTPSPASESEEGEPAGRGPGSPGSGKIDGGRKGDGEGAGGQGGEGSGSGGETRGGETRRRVAFGRDVNPSGEASGPKENGLRRTTKRFEPTPSSILRKASMRVDGGLAVVSSTTPNTHITDNWMEINSSTPFIIRLLTAEDYQDYKEGLIGSLCRASGPPEPLIMNARGGDESDSGSSDSSSELNLILKKTGLGVKMKGRGGRGGGAGEGKNERTGAWHTAKKRREGEEAEGDGEDQWEVAAWTVHFLQPGITHIGSGQESDVRVEGLLEEHCELIYVPGKRHLMGVGCVILRLAGEGAAVSINNESLQKFSELTTGDLLSLGEPSWTRGGCIFYYFNPQQPAPNRSKIRSGATGVGPTESPRGRRGAAFRKDVKPSETAEGSSPLGRSWASSFGGLKKSPSRLPSLDANTWAFLMSEDVSRNGFVSQKTLKAFMNDAGIDLPEITSSQHTADNEDAFLKAGANAAMESLQKNVYL